MKESYVKFLLEHPKEKEKFLKELKLRIEKDIKNREENPNKYIGEKKYLFGEFGKLTNYLSVAGEFIKKQPIYYDKSKIWWIWNFKEFKWEIIDETDILNFIDKSTKNPSTNASVKMELLEGLRRKGRLNKPKEPKESWVQFKDKIYDIETGEIIEANPIYFITNPIKWKFGESEETPALDILFESWVGKEHIQELYEVIAFCMSTDYFIHRLFCLIGSGANGKSTFLKVLSNFLGEENVVSSSLYHLLQGRFEGSKLLKRLVCLMGETNFNIIQNTDYLKKLTGGDLIRAEFKGKDCFDFRNYAKLIMATNSLPPTSDKTIGFYRRWKIIDFPNKFTEEKDVLFNVLDSEYENLALKCFNILKRLWKHRVFTNDGDFDERKRVYEEKSNPLMKFIKEEFVRDIQKQVLFQDFYSGLSSFLEERGFRILSAVAVSRQLKNEGFEIKQMTIDNVTSRFILGLIDKSNTSNTSNTPNPYSIPCVNESRESGYSGYSGYSTNESKTKSNEKADFHKKLGEFGY